MIVYKELKNPYLDLFIMVCIFFSAIIFLDSFLEKRK
jgi:hypothetical protein